MSVETGERQRSGADWDKVRLKRCRSTLIWTFWISFDPCGRVSSSLLSLSLCSTTVTVVRLVWSCYLSKISILTPQNAPHCLLFFLLLLCLSLRYCSFQTLESWISFQISWLYFACITSFFSFYLFFLKSNVLCFQNAVKI